MFSLEENHFRRQHFYNMEHEKFILDTLTQLRSLFKNAFKLEGSKDSSLQEKFKLTREVKI
jgi:hypothetical protein